MKIFWNVPPSSLVQNFLVIPVVVSVWLLDVKDGSGGPKRVVYYHLKYSFRFQKVRACFQRGKLNFI